jgi:phage terminase small subunit
MPKVTTRKGATKGAKKQSPGSRKSDSAKPKKSAKQTAAPADALTDLEQRFCEEYLKNLNGTQAYLTCKPDVTVGSAQVLACRLLAKVKVQERIAELQKARSERTLSDADKVLIGWRDIAEADPTALMEYRRGCCRYCWGTNFRFQRTPREMEIHRADFEFRVRLRAAEEGLNKRDEEMRVLELMEGFDPQGGVGYNRNKPANPECPECFGDGEGFPIFKDTRYLPEHSKRLFAGVKVGAKGLEYKVHSQAHAREMLARHNGMLVAKVEASGPEGGPIPVAMTPGLSPESQEALKRLHDRSKARAQAS